MVSHLNLLITKVTNSNNKGDFAQAKGMIEAIKTKYPNAKLSIFCRNSKDKKFFSKYGQVYEELITPANKKFPKFLLALDLLLNALFVLVWLYFPKLRISNHAKLIFSLYKDADLIINCGGGSLGGYGMGNLFFDAVIRACIAKKFGKKIYHSSLTIEPPKGTFSKILTKFVLNNSDYVTLREPHSQTTIESLGVNTPKLVTADYSFLVKPEPTRENPLKEKIPKNKKIKIGISFSGWRPPFSYRFHNHTTYLENSLFLDSFCESLQQLFEKLDAVVVFFPFGYSEKSNDIKQAQIIKSKIKKQFSDNIVILSDDYSPEELKLMMKDMSVFISTRYHGVVFPTSMLVPTISISFMQKTRGYMDMIGMKEWHIEYPKFSKKILVDTTMKCLQRHDEIVELLGKKIPELEKKAKYNVEIIEQLVDSRK